MKKFFGVVGLIFCVFLASCSFNSLSNKTGTLEFSIPVNDIIKSYNQSAARSSTEIDFDTDSFDAVCLIQVKGNRNYYKSKINSKTFTPADVSNNKLYLDFSFEQVPVGQSYTVMFDLFATDDSGEPNKINAKLYMPIFTGRQEGVSVTAGKSTSINLPASIIKENSLGVKVDFANGTSNIYKGLTLYEEDAINNIDYSDPNAYLIFEEMHSKMSVSLFKEKDKLYYSDFRNPNPLEVTDVSYVLDSNSNFTDSSFKYKVYYEGENGSYVSYDLDFHNNTCSIKDFIMQKDSFYAYYVVMEKAGYQIDLSTAQISYYAQQQSSIDPTQYGFQKLTFNRV